MMMKLENIILPLPLVLKFTFHPFLNYDIFFLESEDLQAFKEL